MTKIISILITYSSLSFAGDFDNFHQLKTQAEREAVLNKYFEPDIGSKVPLDIDWILSRKQLESPLVLGWVDVNPPPGVCFKITRDVSAPDTLVCKPRKLAFSTGEMSSTGVITWKITMNEKEYPRPYEWYSPFRMAQVLKSGFNRPQSIPILNCKTTDVEKRQMYLETYYGEKWYLDFPSRDKLTPGQKTLEELKEEARKKRKEREKNKSMTAKISSWWSSSAKDEDEIEEIIIEEWTVPVQNSYESVSSIFNSSDAPKSSAGKCRYQWTKESNNLNSGWIECHNTNAYDKVLVSLPCGFELRQKIIEDDE